MDAEQVHELEERIATAIDEVLQNLRPELHVESLTTHLMAKAAVTVLEAVEDRRGPGKPPRRGE
jgi:hypothetical protein